MLVERKISANRKIKDRVRLNESALEIHAVQNFFRELFDKFFEVRVRLKLDRKTRIVATAECHPEFARQPIIHRLKDNRVALVFFDINSRTRWPHAKVNRFA